MCGRRAMAGYGFISGKLEIKFLILYIASRLIQPVPFEVLQELSMCDGGVDYFDFAECLADLVRTGHLSRDEEGLYAVTEKGRINGAICESGLAYSVRMQADEGLAAQNERLKRRALVKARAEKRPQGGYTVTLSLSGYGVEEVVLTVGCSDPAALTVQVDGTPVEAAAEGGVLTAALPAAGELSITAQEEVVLSSEEVVLSSVELTVPS